MNPMLIKRRTAMGDAVQNLSISVMVVLGNPRNPDCSQHGICRIDSSVTPICKCQHQAKAWLSSPQPGVARLIFEYSTLRAASIDYFFQNNHFQVQSAYVLPEEVTEKLGLPGELLLIEPGYYPIFRYAGFLEITFLNDAAIK